MMNFSPASRPVKFLLLDDDYEFVSYFLSLANLYNIRIDVCDTLQMARQKIHSSRYDGYIIDLQLPDGSSFELIQEILDMKGYPIAVISNIYRDEKTFELLKNKYEIEYILDKPLYPEQLKSLLVNLYEKHWQAKAIPPADSTIDRALEKSKTNYNKTISQKITLLTQLVQAVQRQPDTNSLTALQNAVHKVAGSAGSYGYRGVSLLAKELEFNIKEKIHLQLPVDKKWLHSLNDFLREIKYNFQFPASADEEHVLPTLPPMIYRPSMYVIDSDKKFLELLQRKKEVFDIDLFVESDAKKAKLRLNSAEFNPRIVIVSQTFLNSTLTGLDLVEIVRQKQGSTGSTIFGLILDSDQIDTRIDAVRRGVKYIFRHPISAEVLLQAMINALEVENFRNYKVLILDDDPDVCNFILTSLSEIGIHVQAIHDPSALYGTLEEFEPNLLLLDVNLPTYNGMDLLKILRTDIRYQHLIIIIITVQIGTETLRTAYSENADSVLYKPLEKKILQKRIVNYAKKFFLTNSSPVHEQIGLGSQKALLKKIYETLITAHRSPSYLVFFRIDDYSELILVHHRNVINKLMVSISNALQLVENSTTSCYFCNASTFAILMASDEAILKEKILNLLTSMQQQTTLEIRFSCSIVPLLKELGNNHQIVQIAENTLEEAYKGGQAPIKMLTFKPRKEQKKKTIAIVEPSEELSLILKTAFESHHFIVKLFKEGNLALQELLGCQAIELPSLIIIERKLPDMDGIEILKNLHARFTFGIPCYFLTQYASEKDISEGIACGALEYITKPFNLAHLIQKSIKTVFE